MQWIKNEVLLLFYLIFVKIQSVPTVMLFHEGKLIDSIFLK